MMALPSNVWSEADKRKAEENLGHILEQFNKALKISAEYKWARDPATKDSKSTTKKAWI